MLRVSSRAPVNALTIWIVSALPSLFQSRAYSANECDLPSVKLRLKASAEPHQAVVTLPEPLLVSSGAMVAADAVHVHGKKNSCGRNTVPDGTLCCPLANQYPLVP